MSDVVNINDRDVGPDKDQEPSPVADHVQRIIMGHMRQRKVPAIQLRANDPIRRDILYRWLERQPLDQIARAYGIKVSAVKKILKDPMVIAEHDRVVKLMTQHMATRMELLVPEAIETVKDTIRGANLEELRFKAAKEVLDRAGSFQKSDDVDGHKDLGAAILRELGRVAASRLVHQQPATHEVDVSPDPEPPVDDRPEEPEPQTPHG